MGNVAEPGKEKIMDSVAIWLEKEDPNKTFRCIWDRDYRRDDYPSRTAWHWMMIRTSTLYIKCGSTLRRVWFYTVYIKCGSTLRRVWFYTVYIECGSTLRRVWFYTLYIECGSTLHRVWFCTVYIECGST